MLQINTKMNKTTIITEISERTGIDQPDVQTIVDTMLQLIQQALLENKEVYLKGFGKFFNKKRSKKIGRNIANNTSLTIEAHHVPVLKMSKAFIEKIKAYVTP